MSALCNGTRPQDKYPGIGCRLAVGSWDYSHTIDTLRPTLRSANTSGAASILNAEEFPCMDLVQNVREGTVGCSMYDSSRGRGYDEVLFIEPRVGFA
jgi:hypothetical protein